jgi:hypothetical protein
MFVTHALRLMIIVRSVDKVHNCLSDKVKKCFGASISMLMVRYWTYRGAFPLNAPLIENLIDEKYSFAHEGHSCLIKNFYKTSEPV